MNKQPVNICIKLNETWRLTIQFFNDEEQIVPTDLTGRIPRVQVRTSPDAATPLLDLTNGNGLTFSPLAGQIIINAGTAPGITTPGNYVWALELGGTPNEEPVSGRFTVEQDIVR